MNRITAELDEEGKRIFLSFDRQTEIRQKIQAIPGAKQSRTTGQWYFIAEFETAKALNRAFGRNLTLGPRLKAWALVLREARRLAGHYAVAETATAHRLPHVLPDLYRALHVGPLGPTLTRSEYVRKLQEPPSFQMADVLFGATVHNFLNANHMGLGKTLETIGTIFEEGSDEGPQLVVAQISSIETVWERELSRWQPHPVLGAKGDRKRRQATLVQAAEWAREGQPFWLIVNPAMVAYQGIWEENLYPPPKRILVDRQPQYQELFDIRWKNVIVDEWHKAGTRDPTSFFNEALRDLPSDYHKALSGTPFGGVERNLWPLLHWLDRREYSSRWRWYEQWLDIGDDGKGHKVVGGLLVEREKEFWKSLTPKVLRRTKAEVLSQLPPKHRIEVWCDMHKEQARQYQEMAELAEVTIEEEELYAVGILAEYTRLKQFADAACTVDVVERDGRRPELLVYPTRQSGKLDQLERLLEELDLANTDEQVVIFSQFSKMVDMVTAWLAERGYRAAKITGAVKRRAAVQDAFQAGELDALVMTTTAGGVSINLDRANTVIFLDETWQPDDQEQAEDRCHRGSRIHQVTCYYLRTKGTVEEYIQTVTDEKQRINDRILDLRRRGMTALKSAGQ